MDMDSNGYELHSPLPTYRPNDNVQNPSLPPSEQSKEDAQEKTNPHLRPDLDEDQSGPDPGAHPIDHLIEDAEKHFQRMLKTESHDIKGAAEAYRQRRGRHPPPGFDIWYQFAKERDAVMVEAFWDQIYHDINPFWAVPAHFIRGQAQGFEMTIRIRRGRATADSNWFWTQIWLNMIQTIEHLLPDMDIALNAMDEPRVVVPSEKMDEYMTEERKTRRLARPEDVVDQFPHLTFPDTAYDMKSLAVHMNWETSGSYWDIVRRGCAPASPSRQAETTTNFSQTPQMLRFAERHMHHGYVANATLSSDICHQPDLQDLEGIFIEPLSISSTDILLPLFGGSKLSVNSEILLPAPMYWNEEERFSSGSDHGIMWAQKEDQAVWRGVATGGRNRESNWRGFQRHRFVAMNNGTTVSLAESQAQAAPNFQLPTPPHQASAQEDGRLGAWVESWSNCHFVDMMCDVQSNTSGCPYVDDHFSTVKGLSLREQFNRKYLPDIDGNSFSGRYLAFMRSTSLPIKATIWREWHDARLVAWKHYVPMDNRFGDWYGIMEYFLGYGDSVPDHDAAAEKIATDGKQWAEKVLRKEDMQVYVIRLLLEYARVSSEKRDHMGWVDDLLPTR